MLADAVLLPLALAYHERLPQVGPLMELLDCCRLQTALQWLGWAPDWSPPPEHTHDWLGEALNLAEQILA